MTDDEDQNMTVDEFKERLGEFDKAPQTMKDFMVQYMEEVENQLESDDFLPGLDVTWNGACDLLTDICRAAHFTAQHKEKEG